MNREAFRKALDSLRIACDDAHAVSEDMLRAPRARELGPALHAKNYGDARNGVVSALDFLAMLVADDETPRDPSGNGGSPAH